MPNQEQHRPTNPGPADKMKALHHPDIPFVPARKGVLVRWRSMDEQVTKGGIVIPDTVYRNNGSDSTLQACVVAVGPESPYEVGDELLIYKLVGNAVQILAESFQLLRDEDVLGKFLPTKKVESHN